MRDVAVSEYKNKSMRPALSLAKEILFIRLRASIFVSGFIFVMLSMTPSPSSSAGFRRFNYVSGIEYRTTDMTRADDIISGADVLMIALSAISTLHARITSRLTRAIIFTTPRAHSANTSYVAVVKVLYNLYFMPFRAASFMPMTSFEPIPGSAAAMNTIYHIATAAPENAFAFYTRLGK